MLTDCLTQKCRKFSNGLASFQTSCKGMTWPYLSSVCGATELNCKARTGFGAAPKADGAFFCSFLGTGGGARGTVACAQRVHQ